MATGDTFCYELADWIMVDEKHDGWKEFPVIWPAILIPQGNISVQCITSPREHTSDEFLQSNHPLLYDVLIITQP